MFNEMNLNIFVTSEKVLHREMEKVNIYTHNFTGRE